jgi:Phage integrase family
MRMTARLPDCITRRKKSDGTLGFRVYIRRTGVPNYSHTFDTLKEALAKRDEYLGRVRKLQAGGFNDSVTVSHAIEGYKQSDGFRSLAHPATVECVLKYWEERLGKMRLSDLPGTRCAVERDRLVKIKNTGSTVCAYLSGLSVAWSWAHENLGSVTNQLLTISWSKIKRGPPAKFTAEQLRHILKRADGYTKWKPLGLLVRLTMITTQRKKTLLNIRWRDVDLDAGTIEVARVKNGRTMSLPVEGETLDLLRAYAKATSTKPERYLFESPKVARAAADAGVPACGRSTLPPDTVDTCACDSRPVPPGAATRAGAGNRSVDTAPQVRACERTAAHPTAHVASDSASRCDPVPPEHRPDAH